jgi:apolipoprotein D and lipocalin family protein
MMHHCGKWMTAPGLVFILASCFSERTDHIPAVPEFDPSRYAGVWYEILRNDHGFERNLSHVTATYTILKDSSIGVVNRGYHTKKKKWVEATARGRYRNQTGRGEFKVSFFRPFYAAYKIIELGPDYEYAVVTSSSINYFWVLSRTPTLSGDLLRDILTRAEKWGFDPSGIIRVDQSKDTKPVENTMSPPSSQSHTVL